VADLQLTIDGISCTVPEGTTILDAAVAAGIYVPTLCSHANLPALENLPSEPVEVRVEGSGPGEGCGVCVVEADGRIVRSCVTPAAEGMIVVTAANPFLAYIRRKLGEPPSDDDDSS